MDKIRYWSKAMPMLFLSGVMAIGAINEALENTDTANDNQPLTLQFNQTAPYPAKKPDIAGSLVAQKPQTQSRDTASREISHVYVTNAGKQYPIDTQTHKAIQKVSKETGIPPDAQMAVCARESSCRPEQINPSSGACGMMQFMTDQKVATLYEVTFQYAAKAGYKEAQKLVERYEKSRDKDGRPYLGYRPVNAAAKQKLVDLCLDPEFNLTMWAAYTRPKIDTHEKWLGSGRKLTPGELVAMNNIGQKGLQIFFEQVMTDKKGKNTLALDFFKKHAGVFGNISGNKSLLYDEKGQALTVRQSYNRLINEHGGWGELRLATAAP